jgi:hypothetical protein
MNEFDKENLEFFMQSDKATIRDWCEWADQENMAYAMKLIQTEIARLEISSLELTDDVDNTDDADRAILEMLEKFDTK